MAIHLPVGFKFHPTDQELLGYYLRHKVSGKPFKYETQIKSFDLYGQTEPWDIWTEFGGPELDESEDLYFFTELKSKSMSGSSYYARKSGSGAWKGKTKGVIIYDFRNNNKMVLGTRKLFHYENNGSDQSHCWLMHEYSLPRSMTSNLSHEYVLCRLRINVDRRRKLIAKKGFQNHVNDEATDQEYEQEDQLSDTNLLSKNNDGFNSSSDHVNNASEAILTSQSLPNHSNEEVIKACVTNMEVTIDDEIVHDYPLYEDNVFSSIKVGDTQGSHGLQQQPFATENEIVKGGSYAPCSYPPCFQRNR